MGDRILIATQTALWRKKLLNHTALGALTAAAVVAVPPLAEAQVLDEIRVTAQKREESLQDVPISVAVVSGAKLATTGINKVEDIQVLLPSFQMTETGISTQMQVRGIGSGINPAFEQSVGQYVDGIHYGRMRLIRAPWLDLERVELVRGSQAVLFGKNTIAGALNITTAQPTDELEGSVFAEYAPEFDKYDLRGVVSGPFSDRMRGRLAVRYFEDGGYVKNNFTGEDNPEREEFSIRGTVAFDVSDNFDITLKAEHNTFDTKGRQIEVVQDTPASAGPFAGANFDTIMGLLALPGSSDFLTTSTQDYHRDEDAGEFSNNEMTNVTLTANYDFDFATLTSVTGYMTYETDDLCDCDFTAAPLLAPILQEEYDQFSQEFRLASPTDQTVSWIAGVFYQTYEIDMHDETRIPAGGVASALPGLSPAFASFATVDGTASSRDFTTESDAWSVFASATWNATERLRVTLGARYTEEEKDGTRVLNVIDTATGTPLAGVPVLVWKGALGTDSEQLAGHNLSGNRKESSLTPSLNVQFDATDNVMLYGSWTTGFKAGGFDARANNAGNFEFEDESAETFEAGAKLSLLDGAAELNVSVFKTDYEDLQVSQFDGTVGFNVGNASETEIKGVEIDGRWALTDNLTLSGGASYLDFEYTDFRNGNCYNGQTPDGDVVLGIPLCDYTGKRGQYTPEWKGVVSLSHILPLSNGWNILSNLDVSYTGEQNVHVNLDPQYEVDGYTLVNLRVGLETDNWELAVLGKNMLDEDHLTYAGNVPLSGSTFGTNTFYAFSAPPRQISVQAKLKF